MITLSYYYISDSVTNLKSKENIIIFHFDGVRGWKTPRLPIFDPLLFKLLLRNKDLLFIMNEYNKYTNKKTHFC